MIRYIISLYSPRYARTVVYMLQSTDYEPVQFLQWYWRTKNFSRVMRRRTLDYTRPARLLLFAMKSGLLGQAILGAILLYFGIATDAASSLVLGLIAVVSAPVIWAHAIIVPLIVGRELLIKPRQKRLIAESRKTFAEHPGQIIGIAGSYGKTSMKEMLATVLGTGKKVAVTPENKNVAISHAYFAKKLAGDEDIVVIEYGEGKPGDVHEFANNTRPNIGIITGIAPAHLDQYASTDDAARDIFSLADYLNNENVYVNGDSQAADQFVREGHILYSQSGVAGWKISNVKVSFNGTGFTLSNGTKKLHLTSALIGRHHIGPLSAVAVLGLKLGLTEGQVIEGIAQTKSYEHRMHARNLHGAWIIDDTYNGNIEGIRAGLSLLGELPAKRKIYVTPGLVDQGAETESVHNEMGRLIAESNPDEVVLMQNSVTSFIQNGLTEVGFKGKLRIEADPLSFYTGIEHVVAAGDVILMQNDWTDNYN